jgi:hypothetical protein
MKQHSTIIAEGSLHNSIQITIGLISDDGAQRHVVKAMEYMPHEADEHPGPSLVLAGHVAQKLMDDLWNCGLRPSVDINTFIGAPINVTASGRWNTYMAGCIDNYNTSGYMPGVTPNQPAATQDDKQ